MTSETRGFGSTPTLRRTEQYRVLYASPVKVAVRSLSFEVSGPEGKDKEALAFPRYYDEIVADGVQYYALDAYRQRYVLRRLDKKGLEGSPPSAGIFVDYTFGDILLRGGSSYLSQAKKEGKYLGEESVGGIKCHKITYNPQSTVWVGEKDDLIRRVEYRLDSPMVLIEEYKIRQINKPIPPTEFKIYPLKTARKVTKF